MPPTRPPAEEDRLPMVSWFDPGQLVKTGVEVAISTIFGRHSDQRLIEALFRRDSKDPNAHSPDADYSGEDEIWIDYVSDTGDGWNPTYAVAYHVAQPSLAVGHDQPLSRGRILIFGGDEVYPTASRAEYKRRFVAAYETALPHSHAPHPDAFAIPGNHDWYDSLVSYTRVFVSKDWLGGWKTPQRSSYFAIKLPQGWWLLGTDVQLGSDIDGPQVEFFESIAQRMATEDRVILCNAEPHWIEAATYGQQEAAAAPNKVRKWMRAAVKGKNDPDANERNLMFLEEKILGNRIRVFLAGDLHHYRRHAADDGTQKITCGGGGAFLHPTYGPSVKTIQERGLDGRVKRTFTQRFAFPGAGRSAWLALRNVFLGVLNPWLGGVTGPLYFMLGWILVGQGFDFSASGFFAGISRVCAELLSRPGLTMMLVALIGALILFTDTHSRFQRWVGGAAHGVAHLLAMFTLAWTGAWAVVSWLGPAGGALLFLLIGGYFVGPFVLGLYLLVSFLIFRRHANEAFSSLHIQDWKSFLRMHIGKDGTLTIYPIGIDRVPRRWKETRDPGGLDTSALAPDPDDSDATSPRLLEEPIIVTKRSASAA